MNTLNAFLSDCEIRMLGIQTVKGYKQKLTVFTHVTPKIDNKLALTEFLLRYPNPRTRHGMFRAVRTFVRWCAANDLAPDWLGSYKIPCPAAAPAQVLTPDEFEKIMQAIPRTLAGKRNRTIYTVLFYTGARRDAIRLLTWDRVSIPDRTIQVITKGRKELLLPLPRAAAQALNLWKVQCPSDKWVFPSTRRPERAIAKDHVTRKIHVYALAAGITRRVYVHLLRHSFCTAMVEAGVSLDIVQAAAGHSSIQTTQIYARMSPRRVRDAVNAVFA